MCFVELYSAEFHEPFRRRPKYLGRERGTLRKTSVHQRIHASSSHHVVCHGQRGCEILLNEEVEDLIRVRGWSGENCLPKWPGWREPFESLRIRVPDDTE